MDIRYDVRMCFTEATGKLPTRTIESPQRVYYDGLHGRLIHSVIVPLFREDESEVCAIDLEAREL